MEGSPGHDFSYLNHQTIRDILLVSVLIRGAALRSPGVLEPWRTVWRCAAEIQSSRSAWPKLAIKIFPRTKAYFTGTVSPDISA
jgi:hypothetical protein